MLGELLRKHIEKRHSPVGRHRLGISIVYTVIARFKPIKRYLLLRSIIGSPYIFGRFVKPLVILGGIIGLDLLKSGIIVKSPPHFIFHLRTVHLKHFHKLYLKRREPLLQPLLQ